MCFSPLFSEGFPLCVNSEMRNAGNVVPPPLWWPRVGHRLYASQVSPMSPLLGNPVEFFTASKWKRGTCYSCCRCDVLYHKAMAIYIYRILGNGKKKEMKENKMCHKSEAAGYCSALYHKQFCVCRSPLKICGNILWCACMSDDACGNLSGLHLLTWWTVIFSMEEKLKAQIKWMKHKLNICWLIWVVYFDSVCLCCCGFSSDIVLLCRSDCDQI